MVFSLLFPETLLVGGFVERGKSLGSSELVVSSPFHDSVDVCDGRL